MIGRKNLHVTAERANFPLGALNVRAGSAANVALFDVPVRAGVSVTAVWMRVTNCDGESDDFAAVQTGTLWVVDVPASHFSTPGEVPSGVEVWASGTGADGDPHTWSIGVGDLCVLDGDSGAPVPGVAWTAIKLRETTPTNPAYGDAKIEGGALYVWDGSQWVGGGGGGGGIVDDTVTRTSSNAVKSSGIWSAIWGTLTALPTGFTALYDWCVEQLAGKLSKSGGTMTGEITMNRGNAVVFGDANGPAVYSNDGTTLKADTRGTTGDVALLSDIPAVPTVPTASSSSPVMDGVASAGMAGTYACGDHVHPTDTTRAPLGALADAFDQTLGCSIGQLVTYAGQLYRSDGLPPDLPWDPTLAELVTIAEMLDLKLDVGGQFGGVRYAWGEGATGRALKLTVNQGLGSAEVYEFYRSDSGARSATCVARLGDLDGKLSTAGATRSVTAEDSGGTETYKFAGTGETTDANTVVRVKNLPYINEGEAEEMLVDVYAISSRGVQRHTAASGETSATFGFADTPGTGKIADAILDIDNSGNTSALGMEFYGLGTTFVLVAPDGDDLAEITSVDGGKWARFYFTETALVSNNLPVISVQRITLGAVATAITRGS